jgi:hypothetical protein
MRELLPLFVLGIATIAVYGPSEAGLVLAIQTSSSMRRLALRTSHRRMVVNR